MTQIEKTLNDYSLLHSFEVTHKVGKWDQTRLVIVKDKNGSPELAMRALTLGEKIKTMFGWRPASVIDIKLLLPTNAPQELASKVNAIFKDVGEFKVREPLQDRQFELLTAACSCGNVATVKKLLNISSTKVLLDQPLEDGKTLLMLAAMNGHQAIVKALLEAGANPTLKDPAGNTAFLLAGDKGHSKIADMIVKKEWIAPK